MDPIQARAGAGIRSAFRGRASCCSRKVLSSLPPAHFSPTHRLRGYGICASAIGSRSTTPVPGTRSSAPMTVTTAQGNQPGPAVPGRTAGREGGTLGSCRIINLASACSLFASSPVSIAYQGVFRRAHFSTPLLHRQFKRRSHQAILCLLNRYGSHYVVKIQRNTSYMADVDFRHFLISLLDTENRERV
jgi:hypothetical protein